MPRQKRSKNTAGTTKRKALQSLPVEQGLLVLSEEILMLILQFLTVFDDIVALRCTCTDLLRISKDEKLYKISAFEERFFEGLNLDPLKKYTQTRILRGPACLNPFRAARLDLISGTCYYYGKVGDIDRLPVYTDPRQFLEAIGYCAFAAMNKLVAVRIQTSLPYALGTTRIMDSLPRSNVHNTLFVCYQKRFGYSIQSGEDQAKPFMLYETVSGITSVEATQILANISMLLPGRVMGMAHKGQPLAVLDVTTKSWNTNLCISTMVEIPVVFCPTGIMGMLSRTHYQGWFSELPQMKNTAAFIREQGLSEHYSDLLSVIDDTARAHDLLESANRRSTDMLRLRQKAFNKA